MPGYPLLTKSMALDSDSDRREGLNWQGSSSLPETDKIVSDAKLSFVRPSNERRLQGEHPHQSSSNSN